MTAPNPESVVRCVQGALADARIEGSEVDLVSGHLTATGADPREVASWSKALGRGPSDFPVLVATKSLVGHALGAAGAVESIAALLMLEGGFAHPSINCGDVHPEIAPHAGSSPRARKGRAPGRIVRTACRGCGEIKEGAVT